MADLLNIMYDATAPTWAVRIARSIVTGEIDPVDAANTLEVLALAAARFRESMAELVHHLPEVHHGLASWSHHHGNGGNYHSHPLGAGS